MTDDDIRRIENVDDAPPSVQPRVRAHLLLYSHTYIEHTDDGWQCIDPMEAAVFH